VVSVEVGQMVINVPRDESKKKEMIDWLTDNISKENVRWWFEDEVKGRVMIDLTEEEQPLLTLFLLRWTSAE
jgi:hypothetical protein